MNTDIRSDKKLETNSHRFLGDVFAVENKIFLSFLSENNTTLSSDNHLSFRKNLVEQIKKLTIDI